MPASLGGRHGGHKRLFMGHVLENLVHRFDAPHQVGAAAAAPPCGSKDGGPCGPGNGVLAAGPKWGRRAATGHAHGYAPSRICLRTRVCVLVRQFAHQCHRVADRPRAAGEPVDHVQLCMGRIAADGTVGDAFRAHVPHGGGH